MGVERQVKGEGKFRGWGKRGSGRFGRDQAPETASETECEGGMKKEILAF